MPAVLVPVAQRLVRGGREAGVPVVHVAGHEQSQLQYLRANTGRVRVGLMASPSRYDCVSFEFREAGGPERLAQELKT